MSIHDPQRRRSRAPRRGAGRAGVLWCFAALVCAVPACNAVFGIDRLDYGAASPTGAAAAAGTAGAAGLGSGAGAAAGGAAGAQPTGGTNPGAEICTNGIDDDGNGDIDCMDPACFSGFACAARPTALGWSDAAVVFWNASSDVQCAGAWPIELFRGGVLPIAPPSCADCSCSAPTGGQCISSVTIWDTSGCTGQQAQLPEPDSACHPRPDPMPANGWDGFTGAAISVSGRSCQAGGGAPNGLPASFTTTALVCGGTEAGGGCGDSADCVPRPASPYDPQWCIMASGVQACPAPGVYSDQHILYGGLLDGRGCTACVCGAKTGADCSGETLAYTPETNLNCTGTPQHVSHSVACVDMNGNVGSYHFAPGSPTGGACAVSGGAPTGAVTGTGPMTICCTVPS